METIATFNNPEEAYIAAGMLRSNGIQAIVQDNNNLYVPIFNGVNVMVASEDVAEARKLLQNDGDQA